MCHLKNDLPLPERVLCKLRCGRKLYSTVIRCTKIVNCIQHIEQPVEACSTCLTAALKFDQIDCSSLEQTGRRRWPVNCFLKNGVLGVRYAPG